MQYFDGYVSMGLKPIAIFKDSKCPTEVAWNKNWSNSRWRHYFHTEEYNIGIILGDIIDVEGDSEESCKLLESMLEGVVRPKFRSFKSVHNLFINPDPDLTRTVIQGIEFRGNLHQTVVPPSTHENGTRYNFLVGSLFPIPVMPPKLQEFYFQNKKITKPNFIQKRKLKSGFVKTICKICQNYRFIHEKRLKLEVNAFQKYNLPWMCHACREFDIRNLCREIRNSSKKIELHY